MCFYSFAEKQIFSHAGVFMRRIMQFLSVILLAGFIFNHPAKAQEVNADSIRYIAASLSKDLADPFAKLDLANNIRQFFEWRVKITPLGYEDKDKFQQQFKEAFVVFVQTLYSKNLEGAESRLTQKTIESMVGSYMKNSHRFNEFYSKSQRYHKAYSEKPPSTMMLQIVQFAIILNESETGLLETIMESTGIWPFC
jgi:hypothetical protein